jgi:hypothetical protein
MVKCLLCGIEKDWSIVEHLKHSHELTCEEYRKQFPCASVKSIEAIQNISNMHKKIWSNDEYREKMIISRRRTHRSEKFRNEQSIRLKAYYDMGGKTWNDGLSKETDDRILDAARATSLALTGRTKTTHEYLMIHSEKMKNKRCWPSRTDWSIERLKLWRMKISNTLAKKHANGEIKNDSNRYKVGIHQSLQGHTERFQSGWEKDFMVMLDERFQRGLISCWTKKHGIIIEYSLNDVLRSYVPDFLITVSGVEHIIELKGFANQIETEVKIIAANRVFGKNFRICFSLHEAKEILDEIIEN